MTKADNKSVQIRVDYRAPEINGWIESIITMGGNDLGVPVRKIGLEMITKAMEKLEEETGQKFLPKYSIFPSDGLMFEKAIFFAGDKKEFFVALKDRVVKLCRLLLEWVVPPGVLKEKIVQVLQDETPVGLISWQDMEAQDLAYTLLFNGFNPHTLHRSKQGQDGEQPDALLQLTAKYRADA